MRRGIHIALLALLALVLLRPATAQFTISVSFGPPALPVYEQPVCPVEGYMWVPGYWYWDAVYEDYYWVPGTWVLAPEPGFLWTPGWWGWEDGGFLFHDGYWANEIGFYGGVNYGFGYFGVGFAGGRWDGGVFRYNTAVLNVNTTIIHNTYIDRTVIVNNNVNRVSYNGGEGGIVPGELAPGRAGVDSMGKIEASGDDNFFIAFGQGVQHDPFGGLVEREDEQRERGNAAGWF